MRTTCIAHPENEPLVMFRQWQVEACNNNYCAAALLNYFEYWHTIRLNQVTRSARQNEIAEIHGDEGTQDTSLYQFHNEEELEDGILNLYKKDTIAKAVKLLEELGFITVHRNPNPRYKFDKTRYFLFLPDNVNRWLKNRSSSPKNRSQSTKKRGRSSKNQSAITEITSEITDQDYLHTEQACEKEEMSLPTVGAKPTEPEQVESELQQPNSPEPEQVTSNCFPSGQSVNQPVGRADNLEDKNSAAPNFSAKTQSSFASSAERHERQFKPLPPWMESKRRAHAGFAEYIRKHHLMRVSSFQGNPTITDAHSWIVKGIYGDEREIQVELQWEAYQESLRVAAEREAQRVQQAQPQSVDDDAPLDEARKKALLAQLEEARQTAARNAARWKRA